MMDCVPTKTLFFGAYSCCPLYSRLTKTTAKSLVFLNREMPFPSLMQISFHNLFIGFKGNILKQKKQLHIRAVFHKFEVSIILNA